MKTYITSDLHFGHTNIMKFCSESRKRFNNDVTFMNETMINEWNNLIGSEDTVYILGDVAFLNVEKAVDILVQLNGKKILVEGNHDRKLLLDNKFRSCYSEIHTYLSLNYKGFQCIMFHFPILEWDRMHRGSLHFYGHLHGKPSGLEEYRAMDVGMDATNVIAIELDEAISKIINRKIKEHHNNDHA